MNRFHFLTEAEIDKAKDELLAQLSNDDLESIVSELDEAPMSNDQMRAGRFGVNPLKQPAAQRQPIRQEPKPQAKQEPKPQAKQEPKPQAKQEPKPQPKKVEPARKAEIKQTVDQLKPKEKTALVKAAKAELKKREASPKEVKPAQPGKLKKVVKNLALAAVAATVIGGMFGGGNDSPTGADSTPQATVVQTTELSPSVVKKVMDEILKDDPQVLSYELQGNELNITIDPKIINGYNNFVLARSKGGQLQQGNEPSDALDYYGFNDSYIDSIKSKVPGLNKVTFSVGTSSGSLMTGEDFMSIAKRMTLPGMPDPANDPNTENFAKIIDLDNGKYFNIPKPVRGEEAEIFQSIMLGAITDAVSAQRDPNVDKDEFLKNPLRATLRYSLGKRYPVTEDLDRLKTLAGIKLQ